MKAEELILSRFEVIADYPDSQFKVGEIEDRDWSLFPDGDETKEPIWSISDFPHLFRKLNWWEHRTIEQMPKKLIYKATEDSSEVYEIEEWDMERLIGWIDKENRSCCSLLSFNPEYGYFPID